MYHKEEQNVDGGEELEMQGIDGIVDWRDG